MSSRWKLNGLIFRMALAVDWKGSRVQRSGRRSVEGVGDGYRASCVEGAACCCRCLACHHDGMAIRVSSQSIQNVKTQDVR